MGLRDTAFRIYWWLEKRIAPEVRYAQYDYEDVLFNIVPPGAIWLDVGCGHQLLPEWRKKQEPDTLKRRLIRILEGRTEEDVFPTYYRANTERSICQLAHELGFGIEAIKLVTSSGHAIFAFCPPITVAELLYIKAINKYHLLRHLRGNMIGVLRKPLENEAS